MIALKKRNNDNKIVRFNMNNNRLTDFDSDIMTTDKRYCLKLSNNNVLIVFGKYYVLYSNYLRIHKLVYTLDILFGNYYNTYVIHHMIELHNHDILVIYHSHDINKYMFLQFYFEDNKLKLHHNMLGHFRNDFNNKPCGMIETNDNRIIVKNNNNTILLFTPLHI